MVYSKNTPTKKPRVWYSIGNASFFPLEKIKKKPVLLLSQPWWLRPNGPKSQYECHYQAVYITQARQNKELQTRNLCALPVRTEQN